MTEPMTPEREAEIKARCDAATPGAKLMRYDHGGGRLMLDDGNNRQLIADFYDEANREFFCYAREDVLYLLAEISGVRAELSQRDLCRHRMTVIRR